MNQKYVLYYVYSQQPSYFMEFKYNFHFMPVHTFKLVTF